MMILPLIPLFFMSSLFKIEAQSPDDQANFNPQDAVTNFQPSLAVVIGILSIMFLITFILLVYAKFCHRDRSSGHRGTGDTENPTVAVRSRSTRFSGIDKTVIESLPFFRFSSLKGLRQGLECVVCLSKFEDVETLRLLPKCKHAFHIDCIDHWLEKHSSCPLCRRKVSTEDMAMFACSSSMRVIDQGAGDGPGFEVFIEREESSLFGGFGSSFRRIFRGNGNDSNVNNGMNDGERRETGEIREQEELEYHRFNHKIVVSGAMINPRWSNLTTSDLVYLSKEMTNFTGIHQLSKLQPKANPDDTVANLQSDSSNVIAKIKEEMERKRTFENRLSSSISNATLIPPTTRTEEGNTFGGGSKAVSTANRRVVSEITAVSRFEENAEDSARDERMRRIWLPIASRTIHWFANRERNPHHDDHRHHQPLQS
ncbi:hypothetical protein MLD38_014334 [Melastoma candidum]|uniref:Uncharacterized protein n=1 Tax=Melastoma candidum TaxID=119954 RepID=A0ACB9RCE6_9MYRT|nr:hypothetical protein MLD38_014334 [Melastoma candidum]